MSLPKGDLPSEPPLENPISNPPFSEQELSALIQQVETFVDKLEEAGHANMEQATKEYGEHVSYAHRLAMAAAIGMLRRFEEKPVTWVPDTAEKLSHRFVLATSFLQGVYHCYEAIGKSLYVQAAALLRQEMETIAALVSARKGHNSGPGCR
jgi:hypothetical protein